MPAGNALQTATRLGELAGVPQPDEALRTSNPTRARLQGQVTAADISPNGNTLATFWLRGSSGRPSAWEGQQPTVPSTR